MNKLEYYYLSELNEEFNIDTLHAVVLAAEQNRLYSKYSNLIANNKEMFIYWYKQAQQEISKKMALIALLAIKADLSKEQSIFTVSEILTNNVTAENKRNLELFYSSPYHIRVNAAKHTRYYAESSIYHKWRDYLFNESSLNYYDVNNVYAEIIDTEIVNYRDKTSVADIFEERTAQLGKDILYKNNFYANGNVLSYRLHLLYSIEYELYNTTDNSIYNFFINYPWQIRTRATRRKYTLIDKYITKEDAIKQADSKQLVYYNQRAIANLLLRNIAIYGLNIPLGMVQNFFHHYRGSIDSLHMIMVLGFNLSIKLTYALDEIQILTLICTGVLVNSITGAELSYNLNFIWYSHVKLYQVMESMSISLHMFNHEFAPLINEYGLYSSIYERIADKVMLYMQNRISATTLMSHFAISNYCLIKGKQVLSWEQADVHDIMDTLQLLWSCTGDELQLNDHDIFISRNYLLTYMNDIHYIWLGDVADLLQLDNNALAEQKNIANIYNRVYMLRISYGIEKYFRRNSYIRGDGQIYNQRSDKSLHYSTPTEMAQAIDLSAMENANIGMLSIIDAFDLLNNPDLWQKFKQDLNLDWSISKFANI